MAKVHRLRSEDELGDEACEWIARLNAPDASAEDKARFEQWRAADPRHARAVGEAAVIWRRLIDVGEIARAVSEGQKLNAITQRAIRRSLQSRARNRRLALSVAAVVLIAVSASWWAGTRRGEEVFQTAIGEHSLVKLADGSALELNSGSLARVAYTGRMRLVKLEQGEAYFDVKADSKRPFAVDAGSSRVWAVGTAFSVDLGSSGVRVTVREGTVKVAQAPVRLAPVSTESATAQATFIKAGQEVNVRGEETRVRALDAPQLARSLAWREGRIYFQDERLAYVAAELSRYSQLNLIVADDGSREFTIAGTFETNAAGVEALLASAENAFGFKVRREGRTVYISRR